MRHSGLFLMPISLLLFLWSISARSEESENSEDQKPPEIEGREFKKIEIHTYTIRRSKVSDFFEVHCNSSRCGTYNTQNIIKIVHFKADDLETRKAYGIDSYKGAVTIVFYKQFTLGAEREHAYPIIIYETDQTEDDILEILAAQRKMHR